jgi:uncharacterized protein (DUF1501 family)
MTSRRQFIQATFGGAALVSMTRSVPSVLFGASRQAILSRGERILIVIEMGGGNDGLNTVVPYGDDEYYRNRFTLAVGREAVLKIDDYVGFHPSLRGFSRLLQQQQLAIVQGVGYPNPNRSHFESMDLWHTAHRNAESSQLGWLGRCVDESPAFAGELPAIHYGEGKQPLALGTRIRPVASISSLEQFRLNVGNKRRFASTLRADLAIARDPGNELLGFIHDSAGVALQTSERLETILDGSVTAGSFPATALGRKLAAIAQLVDSGLPTRVYYVTHNGFDTHSNQAAAHAGLLSELGDAVAALIADLQLRGHDRRTAVIAFSEFGRRVRENASRGTDHGTAAPMFVAGGKVRAGLANRHPGLTDLDQGDLKFSTDYRSVYATVLDNWLGIDSLPILGKSFATLDLFDA